MSLRINPLLDGIYVLRWQPGGEREELLDSKQLVI